MKLTKLGDDPASTVKRMLSEYRIYNCELLLREDVDTGQIVDVLIGNRYLSRINFILY